MEAFQSNTQEILILRKDLWHLTLRCSDRGVKSVRLLKMQGHADQVLGLGLSMGSSIQARHRAWGSVSAHPVSGWMNGPFPHHSSIVSASSVIQKALYHVWTLLPGPWEASWIIATVFATGTASSLHQALVGCQALAEGFGHLAPCNPHDSGGGS